jgi:hypothetical protein
MTIRFLTQAVLVATLAACSSGPIHMAKIDSMIQLYAGAIRFGEFERAQEFMEPSKRERLDIEWLKTIHVSSYDIVYRKENLGGNIYEMTVKIRYFIDTDLVEKSITDHQIWRYDPETQKMLLESGLPKFQ